MKTYEYQSDLHCDSCADQIKVELDADNLDAVLKQSSEFYPQLVPDLGGESVAPRVCGTCGVSLHNPMPEAEGGVDVLEDWNEFYGSNFINTSWI